MGIGVSIFLLAVGAILTFAVNVSTSGFNVHTVGIILMLAGALGVLLTLVFWSSFSPWSRRRRVVDRPYDGYDGYDGDRVVEERRRVRRDVP